MFIEDVLEILEMYYDLTEIPAFYMDAANKIHCRHYSKQLDYHALTSFFDFREPLEFINSVSTQGMQNNLSLNTYHIIYTHNYFIYNIVFLESCQNVKGVIISGPILIYSPDEIRIEEILAYNKLPLHKKPELKSILKNIPMKSMEHIHKHGRLLFALCKSDVKSWSSAKPRVYRKNEIHAKAVFNTQISITLNKNDMNIYKNSYHFIRDARDKIMLGDISGIDDLLDKSIDILWYAGSSMDIFESLKNKYIIVCTLSCAYAIQGKAPYERMMYMFHEFLGKLEMFKTSEEIVSCMISAIRAYTLAVSNLVNNIYSLHVNCVLQYIKNHYTERITLKKLAEHAQINPVYLSSLIKKETKLSISDHVNKIRIEESKVLLANTGKSINEIAFAAGYSYQNHFDAMFKKFAGMTPLEYRKNYGRAEAD